MPPTAFLILIVNLNLALCLLTVNARHLAQSLGDRRGPREYALMVMLCPSSKGHHDRAQHQEKKKDRVNLEREIPTCLRQTAGEGQPHQHH